MRRIVTILLLLLLFHVIGCKHFSSDKDIAYNLEKLIGTSISIPRNLKYYTFSDEKTNDSLEIFSAPIKIITLIDGECGSCIEVLRKWEDFIEKYKNKKKEVSFLIIIRSNSGFENFKWIVGKNRIITYPVFLDTNNEFLELNELPANMMYHTFLIGRNGNIILIGNPYSSKSLEALYIRVLNENLGNN